MAARQTDGLPETPFSYSVLACLLVEHTELDPRGQLLAQEVTDRVLIIGCHQSAGGRRGDAVAAHSRLATSLRLNVAQDDNASAPAAAINAGPTADRRRRVTAATLLVDVSDVRIAIVARSTSAASAS